MTFCRDGELATAAPIAGNGSLVRASGFVSAVLLVLLLATAGWPAEAHPHPARETIACQLLGNSRHPARAEERAERAALPHALLDGATRPRVLPRSRRVDSYGLPPPRAPTV